MQLGLVSLPPVAGGIQGEFCGTINLKPGGNGRLARLKNSGGRRCACPPNFVATGLPLYVLAVFDLIHGKADTDGIAFFVETDLADRGLDVIGLEGFAQRIVIG